MVYLPELYPWQNALWTRTVESLERMPHAILITGAEGTGKFQFASRLAMALLCEAPADSPCAECRNCRFVGAATHPDLHVVTSETRLESLDTTMQRFANRYLDDERLRAKRKNRRSSIVIDQIRALIESAGVKPHISNNKVFLLDPINSMTIAAANSLLKILEEPPPNTFLISIAENDQHLLPTIASRCQKLPMPNPDRKTSEVWLKQQDLPLKAVHAVLESGKGPIVGLRQAQNKDIVRSGEFVDQLIQHVQNDRRNNIFGLVEMGLQLGESECLDELQLLASKIIYQSHQMSGTGDDIDPSFGHLVKRADIKQLYTVYDYMGFLRSKLRAGGMDKTLVVEDALLAFEQAL